MSYLIVDEQYPNILARLVIFKQVYDVYSSGSPARINSIFYSTSSLSHLSIELLSSPQDSGDFPVVGSEES